jgi:hypothetical protein
LVCCRGSFTTYKTDIKLIGLTSSRCIGPTGSID